MSTVSVVATAELGTTPPRVKLDVTDTGSPNLFEATVLRNNPDGTTSSVRTADGNPLTLVTSGSNRVGTVYDYEVPYGAPVTYTTVETPANVSAAVTLAVTSVWLVHPSVPSLSMPISVAEFGDRTRPVERGVFRPMGRKYPVVQTDGARKAPEGTIEVNTFTNVERAAFEALTDDAAVLLLNVPESLGWGVPTCYVSLGDLGEARLVEYAAEQRRVHSLPYLVVDRPAGGTQAARTLADLMDYPTLNSLMTAYPTFNALLAGP